VSPYKETGTIGGSLATSPEIFPSRSAPSRIELDISL
jgi:hypothetical protein